jgi:hypothetical protein
MTILAEPTRLALNDLDATYASATPEAKCYILVGLRRLDPKDSKILVILLGSSTKTVLIERGRILTRKPLAQVAKEIDEGRYDFWLKQGNESR